MKIYISADIEGTTGITDWEEAGKGHPTYQEFRERMTDEVVAACEGAIEAGRDPNKIEIIAKSRVSLNSDKNLARAKLRQVLTFYNIADHYSDMLRGMGFEKEVNAIHEAFQKGGFKAAMGALTDEYMDKLPVVPASDVKEIKEKMKAFEEAGVTRMVIPYVPVTEPVVDDARRFLEAWGNS